MKGETTDRSWWERKASPLSLALVDRLLKLIREIEPQAELKYNKYYIGLRLDGKVRNFVSFRPLKKHVIVHAKGENSEEYASWLESTGLVSLSYDQTWKNHKVRIRDADLSSNADAVRDLIADAHQYFNS